MGSSGAENKLWSHDLWIIRHELTVVDVNFTKLLLYIFIYLAVEWNWLRTFFQLRQPFPQIRGLVFTRISWAALQAQIITLTSFLSGTSFEALKWWKIIQIKTAAEAQNRNLPDLYDNWGAVLKLSFFDHHWQRCTGRHQPIYGRRKHPHIIPTQLLYFIFTVSFSFHRTEIHMRNCSCE